MIMFEDEDIPLYVLVVALVIAIVLLVLDTTIATRSFEIQGKVIGKEYTPSSSSVGVVPNSNGQPGMVVTLSSEKWTLVVRSGDIQTYEVEADIFYAVEEGGSIFLVCRKGVIFGFVNCSDAVLVHN
jgi:hypothetical protein